MGWTRADVEAAYRSQNRALPRNLSLFGDEIAANARKAEECEVTLTLTGNVPSKKNANKSRVIYSEKAGKHIATSFRLKEVQDELKSLVQQVQLQWRGRRPVVHPDITTEFTFPNFGKDEDNAKTAIMDVLQEAGVLVNDNANWNNGWKIEPPIKRGDPLTVVTVKWDPVLQERMAKAIDKQLVLRQKAAERKAARRAARAPKTKGKSVK